VGLVRWQPDGTLGLSMAERAGFEAVA
jgi:hypothetical protein